MKTDKVIRINYKDELGYPQSVAVGGNCLSIIEHRAQGEGDKWHWDIETKQVNMSLFNVDAVYYEK
jgi:hypothetical protein